MVAASRRRGGALSPVSALQLPDNLGARCSLLYVWDEDYTVRAMEAYLQFMELKANFEDWDSEQLAPSNVIDLVWQQHILYNKQYNEACKNYCGQVIGYDPDAKLLQDEKQEEQRVKTTKIALKALYGRKFDGNIWDFRSSGTPQDMPHIKSINSSKVTFESHPAKKDADEMRQSVPDEPPVRRNDTISDSEAESQFNHRQEQRRQPASSHDEPLPQSTPMSGESVTVKIKCFIDGKTQDTCIRVKRTTKMKKVEDCLAKLMNLDGAENVRFLVDGEQVSPWETLESMKVVDPEQHWFTVMPKVTSYQ